MADYPSDKKRDVGYKFSAGILSTDADFSWFAEPFGLSPNQLASDMWVQAVPYAASGNADSAISGYSYITKKNVVLVLEPNTNGTLWLARVGGTLSGNRMRNFINPNNHTNAAGNISLGYTVLIFQSSATGAAGTSITTTDGSWQFMYKEGAFITDDGVTPSDMGWNTTSTTSGEQILHATVYQYEGLNFQPNNNPSASNVLTYNNSGYLEWAAGGGGDPTITDESSDTTCFLTYVNATPDGSTQSLKGGTNLTFNSSIGKLEATILSATASIYADNAYLDTNADNTLGSKLVFTKIRTTGGAAQDNDTIGSIEFDAYNDAGTPELKGFAEIIAKVSDVTDGQEAGRLEFQVAEFDGTKTTGLKIEGNTDVDGEIDVTIGGPTVTSITTISGFLYSTSLATFNSGYSVGGHTVNDIDISSEHVDADDHIMSSKAIKNYVAANGGSVTVSDSNTNASFPIVFHDESNNLHDDTGGFFYNPSTSTMQVGIASIGQATIQTITSEQNSTFKGIFNLHNVQNNSDGAVLNIGNTRAGNAGVNSDECGEIRFKNNNNASTPAEIGYSKIISTIVDSNEGDERGKLELLVANDGTSRNGITMIGSDTAEEVDVTIGNGSDSLTTIAGDLTVTGDIISSKITTSAEQSFLAGNLSIGAHDDQDRIYLARYESSYPEAHIFCGLAGQNVTTGFQVVTKNGSSYQEAFTINGSNRTATFQGNISGLAQLTVANNINANGNIVGDGGTDITNISDISAANGSFTGAVTSVRQTANNIETNIRSSRIGTAAGKIGGLCEQINEGTVYGGGNLTAGRVYFLTEDNTSSGTPSWREATAGAVSGSSGLLAIALGTDPTDGMLLRGMIVISSTQLGNKTPGDTLFLSAATGGRITDTPPSSSGEVQRILGHYFLTTPTDGHSMIHFNPSQEFITIA